MMTVNRSYLVHMKNEQTVKPLDKALDIKPLRALPWFLGCVGSLYEGAKYATWFAPKGFTQSLGKARGALPFDSHLGQALKVDHLLPGFTESTSIFGTPHNH